MPADRRKFQDLYGQGSAAELTGRAPRMLLRAAAPLIEAEEAAAVEQFKAGLAIVEQLAVSESPRWWSRPFTPWTAPVPYPRLFPQDLGGTGSSCIEQSAGESVMMKMRVVLSRQRIKYLGEIAHDIVHWQ